MMVQHSVVALLLSEHALTQPSDRPLQLMAFERRATFLRYTFLRRVQYFVRPSSVVCHSHLSTLLKLFDRYWCDLADKLVSGSRTHCARRGFC